ncbi:RHS repeat protein [Nocardioides sp. W3-2-3]|nr:RHS repeat protein [Nocardioides convexus]
MGRTTKSTLFTYNAPRWSTTTTYDGSDITTLTPPDGAPSVTTTTDIRGRKVKSVEHGTPDLISTYQYDLRDNLREVTSPGGTWTYDYDLRGRKTEAHDPDSGTSTTTYTESDAVATTTDARDKTLLTIYDNLDRTTALYEGGSVDDTKPAQDLDLRHHRQGPSLHADPLPRRPGGRQDRDQGVLLHGGLPADRLQAGPHRRSGLDAVSRASDEPVAHASLERRQDRRRELPPARFGKRQDDPEHRARRL